MAWMKLPPGSGDDTWQWDYKKPDHNTAAIRAAELTKQFNIPVFFRVIPDESLWECYTNAKLEIPQAEHSNLCRCRECYAPPSVNFS